MPPPPRRFPACCWFCITATWTRSTALFPHQEDGTISEVRPPFEDETIYYWGQYVAVVVAETLEQATAAAHAVRVEYDVETPDVRTDLSSRIYRPARKQLEAGRPRPGAFHCAGGVGRDLLDTR